MKLSIAVAGLALVGVLTLWPGSQSQTAVPREPVTVLVDFGLNATTAEQWDGSVRLTRATLVSIAGRHFSAGDSVQPSGSWVCRTRRDFVAPYADVHYTEMRPGSTPETLHKPVGVLLTLEADPGARMTIETRRGTFDFAVSDLGSAPKLFASGAASIRIVPTPEKLTGDVYEDDEPSIAALADGSIAVAWVGYREQADRVFLRTRIQRRWSETEEVSTSPGDIFRTSLAATEDGALWVFWSQRDGERWRLWLRRKPKGGSWQSPVAVSGDESATFHRAAGGGRHVHVVWQGFHDGQSDIFAASSDGQRLSAPKRLSTSVANDWEPAVAVHPVTGEGHAVWDSYDRGNYDIFYRAIGGSGAPWAITSSPRFQAHGSVTVDQRGRVWIAWNESGVNWAKDQGFLIPTPLATPLHQQRWLAAGVFDGTQFRLTAQRPPHMAFNAEHPQLAAAGSGSPVIVFRHWTRQQSRSIGSALVWENYVTAFDGSNWTDPQPLPSSGGWIEKHVQLARDPAGNLWAAWMTDNRPFATMVPSNADVLAARLSPAPAFSGPALKAVGEEQEEAIPVHNNEPADVSAIRAYTISSGGKQYKIFRGDMHRHTDVSQDFKYDGSLFEVYRYALDAAGFDYIAPTDHQTGYNQEFSWWQNQKYVDLFLVPNRFVPLFAYERSLRFPNGHRNIVWAHRGVRTLPVPPEEASGKEGARKLFEHLRQTKGISMPHSSATAQGTDWRDNDPEVEPLIEIYQGYRTSYEYEGAPRAATTLNQQAQKSGWQPEGFWWNALAKGYKLGVQASSDHWSTHISYACILTEKPTREALLDAMRRRHAYAATDNIILDFRARAAGGTEYIQGDVFSSAKPPLLSVKAIGTGAIKQIDLISNKTFLHTVRPGQKQAGFEFTDLNQGRGESWYYVRVLQEDGQLAWSSPVWITRP
jgi:hypothetical protein